MKKCNKCNEIFPLTDEFFGRRNDSPDGYRNDCKVCVKKRLAAWYEKNRQDLLLKMKDYREKNIEHVLSVKREYNKNNREIMVKKCHVYYEENRGKVLSQMKEHRSKNKEKINQKRRDNFPKYAERARRYRTNNLRMITEKAALYCANRRQSDTEYRILCNLRSRIGIAIRKTRSRKITGTTKLLGCTIPELRKHIERQFLPGMSWNNWGLHGWHIDHRIPCACFDLSFPNQQKECFNYKNLRPMWACDNLKKGTKLDHPFQPSLAMAM